MTDYFDRLIRNASGNRNSGMLLEKPIVEVTSSHSPSAISTRSSISSHTDEYNHSNIKRTVMNPIIDTIQSRSTYPSGVISDRKDSHIDGSETPSFVSVSRSRTSGKESQMSEMDQSGINSFSKEHDLNSMDGGKILERIGGNEADSIEITGNENRDRLSSMNRSNSIQREVKELHTHFSNTNSAIVPGTRKSENNTPELHDRQLDINKDIKYYLDNEDYSISKRHGTDTDGHTTMGGTSPIKTIQPDSPGNVAGRVMGTGGSNRGAGIDEAEVTQGPGMKGTHKEINSTDGHQVRHVPQFSLLPQHPSIRRNSMPSSNSIHSTIALDQEKNQVVGKERVGNNGSHHDVHKDPSSAKRDQTKESDFSVIRPRFPVQSHQIRDLSGLFPESGPASSDRLVYVSPGTSAPEQESMQHYDRDQMISADPKQESHEETTDKDLMNQLPGKVGSLIVEAEKDINTAITGKITSALSQFTINQDQGQGPHQILKKVDIITRETSEKYRSGNTRSIGGKNELANHFSSIPDHPEIKGAVPLKWQKSLSSRERSHTDKISSWKPPILTNGDNISEHKTAKMGRTEDVNQKVQRSQIFHPISNNRIRQGQITSSQNIPVISQKKISTDIKATDFNHMTRSQGGMRSGDGRPGEQGKTGSRNVTVKIGTIELRSTEKKVKKRQSRKSGTGFDDFFLSRNYLNR